MAITDTLADYYNLDETDSTVSTEIIAGVTTFLAMSYIIVVNPQILSAAISVPGYSDVEVFQMIAIATILSSFIAIMVMSFYAKLPFGLAPGMSLNTFFAFTVVLVMGIPWQTALAAVFVEGIIFIIITAAGAREYVIDLIPEPVKFSVGAGIGVFLLFIGFQYMQVIVPDEAVGVTIGNIGSNPVALLGLGGLALTLMLWSRGVTGSIIIGIIATTLVGWGLVVTNVVGTQLAPSTLVNPDTGVISFASVTAPQYDITPLAGAFIDGLSSVEPFTFVLIVFTFFFVDFFDTTGTLIGVSQFGGFLDEDGNLPEINKPLMADAVGTTIGAMLGTSTVTTYIESSTGIEEGGRTGLTALVIGLLFLASLILIPLVALIPDYASFIALVVVGIIMLQGVTEINWNDPAWAVSAGLTITVMPLTYNIANGLAAGIIAYPLIKVAMGERDDINLGQWILAAALVIYFYVYTSGILS